MAIRVPLLMLVALAGWPLGSLYCLSLGVRCAYQAHMRRPVVVAPAYGAASQEYSERVCTPGALLARGTLTLVSSLHKFDP